MKETKEIRNLAYFTETAVSPFHTVEAVRNVLHKEEFEELPFSGGWKLERGGKYLVSVYDSLVFAFTVGKEWEPGDGLRMAAAHGDFPGFRVKPCPEVRTGDYVRLNVETYGGVNLMSWLDGPGGAPLGGCVPSGTQTGGFSGAASGDTEYCHPHGAGPE